MSAVTLPPTPAVSRAAVVADDRSGPADGFVDRFGGRYYRIAHIERMPTFFMSIVSASDVWLFLASNGGLSAGRANAEHAIFPYQTVDKIYDSVGHTGACTAFWCESSGESVLWEPFAAHGDRQFPVSRHLYKSIEGDRVWFEEINPALGLVFRSGWTATEEHGLVRLVEIENLRDEPRRIRAFDGVRNLRVPGVSTRLQNEYSCLTDAYKTAELAPGTQLGVFTLAAGIVDRAIPMESLHATTAWADGWPEARVALAPAAYEAFVRGDHRPVVAHARGVRAAYALTGEIHLPAAGVRRWRIILDTDQTQAHVAARARSLLASAQLHAELDTALAASSHRLRALVASSDGMQAGGDETATAHHFANTLFNIMRGGVFAYGHEVDCRDFADFARVRNRPAATRHSALIAALPERAPHADFITLLAAANDPDLERLGHEYLPLTFSRRHGDPSRPWNRFDIRVRDVAGNRILSHEGNWRDIFQNWEALCVSFPAFCESVIAKFLNASTADGYNPYRITRAGIDWEVPEPHDPWASIGYWGDHQTIYLQKLLEWSGRFHPGLLADWLRRPIFTYADVPYRIANYTDIRRNPRATISFDDAAHRRTQARAAELGSDARLVADTRGGVLHVALGEKLLLLALVRLTNLVPEGGIWMNTQRPEWNDANNALVGNGLSVVTLAYLRRFLAHFKDRLLPSAGDAPLPVSAAVAGLFRDVAVALAEHAPALAAPSFGDERRRAFVDAVGEAGSRHRARVYAGDLGAPEPVPVAEITGFLTLALAFVDHSLRANRRADGLWHAYNLLRFSDPAGAAPALAVSHLAPMLEGQVAILSAGLLSPTEAVTLLRALRESPLYRPDQNSYVLYPDKQLPGFLARNVIPGDAVSANPLLTQLLAAGDRRLVLCDASGTHRFRPHLVNGEALTATLDELAGDSAWSSLVAAHRADVEQVYEAVFHHYAFTGRSSSMFGYEGLGCIYWHMVAKLLLAVQENQFAAERDGDAAATDLARHYDDVRDGLGFRKTPAVYGAFPTDPYSHTPGHAGAQQPGMTGQVKEELLVRLSEIGVTIIDGTVEFSPRRLHSRELADKPLVLPCVDHGGRAIELKIPVGGFGFTLCGAPIIYRSDTATDSVDAHLQNGEVRKIPGHRLPPELGCALLARSPGIEFLEVNFRRTPKL